jgi:hypothetical protein
MGIKCLFSSPSEDIIDVNFPLYFTLHGFVSTLTTVNLLNPSSLKLRLALV